MTILKQYIAHGILPDDPVVARKTKTSVTRYVIVRDDLYHTMGDWPLLKCKSEEDEAYVLSRDACGHMQGTSWSKCARKEHVIRYFLPTLREAVEEMVHVCHKCQIHDNNHYIHRNE